jgi:hypothetical protein
MEEWQILHIQDRPKINGFKKKLEKECKQA